MSTNAYAGISDCPQFEQIKKNRSREHVFVVSLLNCVHIFDENWLEHTLALFGTAIRPKGKFWQWLRGFREFQNAVLFLSFSSALFLFVYILCIAVDIWAFDGFFHDFWTQISTGIRGKCWTLEICSIWNQYHTNRKKKCFFKLSIDLYLGPMRMIGQQP